MNRIHHHPAAARSLHARHFAADAIEWEELPSLTRMLRRGDPALGVGHVWLATEPMGLEPPQPAVVTVPSPFAEPIDGLQVREIEGDGVFSHFFGGRSNH